MSTDRRLTVAFAPDWREGNPYQSLLARALAEEGVDVIFSPAGDPGDSLSELAARPGVDLLHLHWPEAFFPPSGPGWRRAWGRLRYAADLRRAAGRRPLILTAHNLYPHDRWQGLGLRSVIRSTYARAADVIVHSLAAAHRVRREFRVSARRIRIIPHGNLADAYPVPPPRDQARLRLGLEPRAPFVLMLGAIERYKGIEDALLYWQKSAPPCALHIVGAPAEAAYLAELQHLAAGHPLIHFTPRWQSDDDLAAWLAAADAVLFNYRRILTSGAAVLARACGVPVLLPERLDVIDLAEPDDRVVRFAGFDADFLPHLDKVLQTGSDFAAARAFRETTAWSRVAAITADLYRSLLPPT